MVALKILAVIAIIIFLIMMIPIGADIGYEGGQLSLSAKVCGIFLQLLPKSEEKKKEKKKKPKKEKEEKPEEPPGEEEQEKSGKKKKKLELDFTFDEIVDLLKTVLRGLGKFFRIKVDRFLLHYTAAGNDPYKTAVLFGKVNAALNALAPICSKRFDCRDTDVYTDISFTEEKMKLDFGLGFSIRIGQIFGALNTILFGALGILIRHKMRKTGEKLREKFSGKKEKRPLPAAESE
ncbi:MAG: hypothetical protein J6P48_03890 [Oscillospiraceae bacterium]|nr:hypothetical protein [Oscillospiraceae bacterium]